MYELKVTAGSTAELGEKLYVLGRQLLGIDAPAEGDVPAAPESKPKRSRTTKAATAEEPTSDAAPAEEPVAEEPTPAPLDFERDAMPVILDYIERKGKPFVVEILTQFGVAKASQLPDDRLQELLDALADAA